MFLSVWFLNPITFVVQVVFCLFFMLVGFSGFSGVAHAQKSLDSLPCDPVSDLLGSEGFSMDRTIHPDFCAEWNPDFVWNGKQCCVQISKRDKRLMTPRFVVPRKTGSYCHEMTEEQRQYSQDVEKNQLGDLLDFLMEEVRYPRTQAFCTVNNGFLAFGRMILPTSENGLWVNSMRSCLNFGTDLMAGMLEWLGREVKREYGGSPYSQVHLVVGNISAPRGGVVLGRSGRRGHLSHTSGQDVDLGFLTVKSRQPSPRSFHTQFDPQANGWLLKKIFENPFACIRAIFLDRRHIQKLKKHPAIRKDPNWQRYFPLLKGHVPGHVHHLHVRIGDFPGSPGCQLDLGQDLSGDSL